jgi:hypothetical protein
MNYPFNCPVVEALSVGVAVPEKRSTVPEKRGMVLEKRDTVTEKMGMVTGKRGTITPCPYEWRFTL